MQIYDTIRKTEYSTVVALGFFDGVHIGHQKVIQACIDESDKNTKSVVFTFKESPYNAVNKEKKPLLTTNEQKLKLIEKLGVDEVYCVDFECVKDLSAHEFVKDVLIDKLNAKCVVTGFNYHFSKGGAADADDMARLCELYGIKCIKCDGVLFEESIVSSSRIRECIACGDIVKANAMLNYNFAIDTAVTKGNHIGTKIDSPTINQPLKSFLIVPKFGVYATKVRALDNITYIGATNIGVHPTVGECEPVCETHLIDVSDCDLYGKKVHTELVAYIRPEQKFSDINELKAQIEKDILQIKSLVK